MFTGIIESMGHLLECQVATGGAKWLIATGFKDLSLGESVAVNGVCLTVSEVDSQGKALFFISPETLACTHFLDSKVGDRFNLERSLRADARLSGHWVQGHVDGLGWLEAAERQGECIELVIRAPFEISKYCVTKGSISINGVSLTINSVQDIDQGSVLSLMIIPHTWTHTQFQDLKPGSRLNLETDLLAKYVERLLCPTLPKP